jgi:hypothetical protein
MWAVKLISMVTAEELIELAHQAETTTQDIDLS